MYEIISGLCFLSIRTVALDIDIIRCSFFTAAIFSCESKWKVFLCTRSSYSSAWQVFATWPRYERLDWSVVKYGIWVTHFIELLSGCIWKLQYVVIDLSLAQATHSAIDGFHLTSRRPCWCTEQCSKMSFGNLTLFICKTCGTIFYCFVHQHGCLITWMQTKDSFLS